MSDLSDVAKVRIFVKRDAERWCLMSRKKTRWRRRLDGKLEFLGGHLQEGESPFMGLVRELREEETTGTFASLTEAAAPVPRLVDLKGAPHHLFELEISETELEQAAHSRKESRGFELVREADLKAGTLDKLLTPRTRQILEAEGRRRRRGLRRLWSGPH